MGWVWGVFQCPWPLILYHHDSTLKSQIGGNSIAVKGALVESSFAKSCVTIALIYSIPLLEK